MLSLNVKPKVFCAVLRARCTCKHSVADKRRAEGRTKIRFKKGPRAGPVCAHKLDVGEGVAPFCSESNYSALVRRQERRKIHMAACENTSSGSTLNAPMVDHDRHAETFHSRAHRLFHGSSWRPAFGSATSPGTAVEYSQCHGR